MAIGRDGINQAVVTLNALNLNRNSRAWAYREDICSNLNVLNGLIELNLRKQNERYSLFRDQHKIKCYNAIIEDIEEAVRLIAQEPDEEADLEAEESEQPNAAVESGEDGAQAKRLKKIQVLVENLKHKAETPRFCCNKMRPLLSLICTGLLALCKIVFFGLVAGVIGVAVGAIIGSSAGPAGTIAGAVAGSMKGVAVGVATAVKTGAATGGILSGIKAGAAAVPVALGSTGSTVGLTASLSMAAIRLHRFFSSPDPIKEQLITTEKSMMALARLRHGTTKQFLLRLL